MSTTAVMAGCEPFVHVAPPNEHDHAGVLVVHGFTGNPSSMRRQARALADAGFHVDQPRLPGHGTSIDEMLATRWSDWSAEVAGAYDRLAERVDSVVIVGLSMGGTLALSTALERRDDPRLVGLVCINPATQPPAPDVVEMVREFDADGVTAVPAVGADIADPDAVEVAYEATPVAPLLSLIDDGIGPITGRYGEIRVPLLLFTSRQDHVVEPTQSEYLAAQYGGEVDHVWLDRSFHVATQDYDADLVTRGVIDFSIDRTAR